MNKVILMGRFTRDPESRTTSAGLEVARFSLACNGEFVNKNGEREAEFINCVAFGNTASTLNKFCHKGDLISAVGRIRNGSYDAQDGSKRYTTDVIVENFEFTSSRGGNNNHSQASNYDNPSFDVPAPKVETTDVSNDPYKDFSEEITLSSDDLPF